MESQHPGKEKICLPLNSFLLNGRNVLRERYKHSVLVFAPAACSVGDMLKRAPIDPEMVQLIMENVLLALDFLHTEARAVHTDIKANNILMTLADHTELDTFARQLQENPPGRKGSKWWDNLVYESRSLEELGVKG